MRMKLGRTEGRKEGRERERGHGGVMEDTRNQYSYTYIQILITGWQISMYIKENNDHNKKKHQ